MFVTLDSLASLSRSHDTARYLCHEFGRLADAYADNFERAARASAEFRLLEGPTRASGATVAEIA